MDSYIDRQQGLSWSERLHWSKHGDCTRFTSPDFRFRGLGPKRPLAYQYGKRAHCNTGMRCSETRTRHLERKIAKARHDHVVVRTSFDAVGARQQLTSRIGILNSGPHVPEGALIDLVIKAARD